MANTTNLNLVKPAGTDKALVSVLNSNSDKIDAWAGSTNQAIQIHNLGSVSSQSAFESAILTAITTGDGLKNGYVHFVIVLNTGFGALQSGRFTGIVMASTTGRYQCNMQSTWQQMVFGIYNSDAWSWEVAALKSTVDNISHLHQYTKSTTSQAGSLTFTTNDDRYVALVFLIDNNMASKGALYCVISKKNVVGTATKIAGNGDSVSVDYATGTITVTANTWTQVIVLTNAANMT